MKFTIEVETDNECNISYAIVKNVIGAHLTDTDIKPIPQDGIQLQKALLDSPPGESWLVLDEKEKHRMIVLSQLQY